MKLMERKQGARRLLILQLITSGLISLVLLIIFDKKAAGSALLGGLVAILPSVLFAKTLFRHQGAGAAKKILKSFYWGEALKIVWSIILFALVFFLVEIVPFAFFITYIGVLMNHWFTPLLFSPRKK